MTPTTTPKPDWHEVDVSQDELEALAAEHVLYQEHTFGVESSPPQLTNQPQPIEASSDVTNQPDQKMTGESTAVGSDGELYD